MSLQNFIIKSNATIFITSTNKKIITLFFKNSSDTEIYKIHNKNSTTDNNVIISYDRKNINIISKQRKLNFKID